MSDAPEPVDTERGLRPDELPQPRPQRSVLPSFLFISFVLFMVTNNQGEDPSTKAHYLDNLSVISEQVANYSGWLNGTAPENFTLVSTLLRALRTRASADTAASQCKMQRSCLWCRAS